MVVSDELVFVELNKTGSTHITQLIRDLVGGERRGVHNAPDTALVESDRHFLGSIRNPWDWYVSLWAYGCQGDGALHKQLTTARLQGHGWRSTPMKATKNLWDDLTRDREKWRQLYADPTDASLFREWLIRVHNEGIGPYSDSRGGDLLGLLSRFYVRLFWHPDHKEQAMRDVESAGQAGQADVEQCYVDYFVRTEHLEDDLADFLTDTLRVSPQEKVDRIYEKTETNSSSRKRDTGYYYDRRTRDLVGAQDALVVDKFGYTPPVF